MISKIKLYDIIVTSNETHIALPHPETGDLTAYSTDTWKAYGITPEGSTTGAVDGYLINAVLRPIARYVAPERLLSGNVKGYIESTVKVWSSKMLGTYSYEIVDGCIKCNDIMIGEDEARQILRAMKGEGDIMPKLEPYDVVITERDRTAIVMPFSRAASGLCGMYIRGGKQHAHDKIDGDMLGDWRILHVKRNGSGPGRFFNLGADEHISRCESIWDAVAYPTRLNEYGVTIEDGTLKVGCQTITLEQVEQAFDDLVKMS